MIIDNPSLIPQDTSIYDVVVIGTGPVGTTIASELISNGKRVLLLEGGEVNWTEKSQNRYSGSIEGANWDQQKYLDGLRLRFLGGTSNHWIGYCVRLEEDDLVDWPISHKELYKNGAKAEKILEIDSFDSSLSELNKKWGKEPFERNHEVRPILRSPPVRFKNKFSELFNDKNLLLCLNANLIDIGLSADKSLVEWISISPTPQATPRTIKVNKIVFCLGAIESTRYMLLLKNKYPNKKDWGSNWIGANFIEHPHFDWDNPIAYSLSPIGSMERHGYTISGDFAKLKLIPAVRPHTSVKKSANLLNYAFTVLNPRKEFKPTNSEVSYFQLMNKLRNPAATQIDKFDIHIINLQTEINPANTNRLELDPIDKDDFGIPRVKLFVATTDRLQRTVESAIRNLQSDFQKFGAFVIRVDDQHSTFTGGAHPMGTTRMGRNYNDGFVNANCKIFGIENAYICSGSVFRSGGYANPTYTLVCLALNVANELLKA